jgi:hypothetical protein
MPKNAKKGAYKEKEFETYLLWKSLPAHFRGMKKKELHAAGFTDPLILKIIKIKNQTQFAKTFHIKDLGTLTDWNNKIKNENITSPVLETTFQNQTSTINKKIILPTIKELENKLLEKNKIIYLLKKEITLLKKKPQPRKPKKLDVVFLPSLPKPTEIIAPIQPVVSLPEPKDTRTLFQKIKGVFFR